MIRVGEDHHPVREACLFGHLLGPSFEPDEDPVVLRDDGGG
jgi:hypothetical protein